MGIEFKPNFDAKKLAEDLRKKQKATLEVAMADAATEIVLRTQKGQDARGSRFKLYSSNYGLLKRQNAGRGATVDLIGFGYTSKKGKRLGSPSPGSMLAAINSRVEIIGNKIVGFIFFNSAREAAKAQGNMRTRKFFELAASQIKKITNKLQGN